MHRKRQRLHLPRLQQVVLVDRRERRGYGLGDHVAVLVAPKFEKLQWGLTAAD
jgi:hypothetical protein